MRGQILGVDIRTGDGQLTGDDGRRYRFRPEDWAHQGEPAIGLQVDFEPDQTYARSIFPLPGAAAGLPVAGGRHEVSAGHPRRRGRDGSRILAALLAFFLGLLGVHRFYLGRTGSGLAMLVLTLTVVGMAVSGPWALIDAIRYLLMSDDEFERRYA